MYFPPYRHLIRAADADTASPAKSDQVTLPRKLLEFLMQAALGKSDFDEERYLKANPDVRDGIADGGELDAKQHFIGFGYFEGRSGGLPKVDERWYLRTYHDVAEAVAAGQVSSATQHFEIIGAAEGRAPSRQYVEVAAQWKSLLGVI